MELTIWDLGEYCTDGHYTRLRKNASLKSREAAMETAKQLAIAYRDAFPDQTIPVHFLYCGDALVWGTTGYYESHGFGMSENYIKSQIAGQFAYDLSN